MPIDRARTARGALAGVIAAGAWSAQAQLDMRAFGVDYSDEALLGKAVTRGPSWPVVGFALHLLNGAAFGAAYTNIAPRLERKLARVIGAVRNSITNAPMGPAIARWIRVA